MDMLAIKVLKRFNPMNHTTKARLREAEHLKEERKRRGNLLRLDGETGEMELYVVKEAHRKVQIQLLHVKAILDSMKRLGEQRFINTDPDYDIVIRNDSEILGDKIDIRVHYKRSLLTSVNSYDAQQQVVYQTVNRAMGDEPFRWRKLCESQHAMKELRNQGAHSYGAESNAGFNDFNSEEYWNNLCSWIPIIYEQITDLEECLYWTVLRLKGEDVTTSVPVSECNDSIQVKLKLSSHSRRECWVANTWQRTVVKPLKPKVNKVARRVLALTANEWDVEHPSISNMKGNW